MRSARQAGACAPALFIRRFIRRLFGDYSANEHLREARAEVRQRDAARRQQGQCAERDGLGARTIDGSESEEVAGGADVRDADLGK